MNTCDPAPSHDVWTYLQYKHAFEKLLESITDEEIPTCLSRLYLMGEREIADAILKTRLRADSECTDP